MCIITGVATLWTTIRSGFVPPCSELLGLPLWLVYPLVEFALCALPLGVVCIAMGQEPRGRTASGNAMERLVSASSHFLHVGPISIIQFSDYISDCFVILAFYASGEVFSARVATACIVISVLSVWVPAIVIAITQLLGSSASRERRVLRDCGAAMLLTPLNLHVLYFGGRHAAASADLE